MIVTSANIRERLRGVWPKLRQIWLTDSEWELPKEENAIALINRVFGKCELPKRKVNKMECEEFALLFHSLMVMEQQEENTNHSYPVGQAIGTAFKDMYVLWSHSLNIFITQESILLVDCQSQKIWVASGDKDRVYFTYIV